jgi:tRNA modification GTPase
MSTIFAPATGVARAGVAVVRVSGLGAKMALEKLAGGVPQPRVATLRDLHDGDVLLDRALVLYFAAPASFTGEDVAEFHLHGGRAVTDGVLAALARLPAFRAAKPGEFTRRAFENGKMDLTEAEAVADLCAAETTAQRAQALMQMGGALSTLCADWAKRLTALLAHQEADIEFPEDDMPDGVAKALRPKIAALELEVAALLDDNRRGERLRDGLFVAIVGAPNAGKSSLLNALARRDAAIVSETPGTTRDVIEVRLDLAGYPVTLADTAGLRETADAIEIEGIRRALKTAGEADLRLVLFDASKPEDAVTRALAAAPDLVLHTKTDLAPAPTGARGVSVKTGAGIDALLAELAARAQRLCGGEGGPALTRARHRAALQEARARLASSLTAPYPELAAEDLRLALRAVGEVTGTVHVEEVLDVVFRDFCIGK